MINDASASKISYI